MSPTTFLQAYNRLEHGEQFLSAQKTLRLLFPLRFEKLSKFRRFCRFLEIGYFHQSPWSKGFWSLAFCPVCMALDGPGWTDFRGYNVSGQKRKFKYAKTLTVDRWWFGRQSFSPWIRYSPFNVIVIRYFVSFLWYDFSHFKNGSGEIIFQN